MTQSTKTINFLPGVFQTPANKKFLGATLDQLVSEPNFKKINGYIGRTFAPTNKSTDSYLPEPSADRQHYQLEPSVVVTDLDKKITFFSSYEDLLQKIRYYGGIVDNHSRLFSNEYYTFDGKIDFDKLVNFNQYYWLPTGPEAVKVFGGTTALTEDYVVTKNESLSAYQFTKFGTEQNPDLVLARGGVYTFTVSQGSNFWIQTSPGIDGRDRGFTNLSSRDVIGVENNGSNSATITFSVPQKDAQSFYTDMPIVWPGTDGNNVDFALSARFVDINHQLLQNINGLDGIKSNLHGKFVVFVSNDLSDDAWEDKGVYALRPWAGDATDASYSHGNFVPVAYRTGVWQIQLEDTGGGNTLLSLNWVQDIPEYSRVVIKSGNEFTGASFFKDTTQLIERVPALTAKLDTLYYVDENDASFYGKITIVDNVGPGVNIPVDILGETSYISPNNIKFTNGLKINFDSGVTPGEYVGKTYYVEGVGTGIRLIDESLLVTPEITSDAAEILDKKDYITINRSSIDGNAWSRSNRWCHEDVIIAAAGYNKTIPLLSQTARAQRPIIEFDPDLKLFNNGITAYHNVDVIDLVTADALLDVEGDFGKYYPLLNLQDGATVVFANDFDPIVKNRVFTIQQLDIMGVIKVHLVPTGAIIEDGDVIIPKVGTLVPLIQLAPPNDGDQWQYNITKRTIVDTISLQSGTDIVKVIDANVGLLRGSSFWFNGINWVEAQKKTKVNVAPLFDLIDKSGTSFSDQTVYPNSSFTGSTLFSYKTGDGKEDEVLGFPLSYRNFNNVGDIEFSNDFDSGTFDVTDFAKIKTTKLNTGYIRKIVSKTDSTQVTPWNIADEETKQYQIISGVFTGQTAYFEIDVIPSATVHVPNFKVFVNNKRISQTQFSVEQVGARVAVHIPVGLVVGDRVDILVYSDDISRLGYYEIPKNLDLNTLNSTFTSMTLGQFRNHLTTIADSSTEIVGVTPGGSNLRDLNIKPRGGSILQHSAPSIYSSVFLLHETVNFVDSAQHAQQEYTRFKNRFLELSTEVIDKNIREVDVGVDHIMTRLNAIKNITSPWYYSDMVPYDTDRTIIDYSVLNAEIIEYQLDSIYDETKLSNQAVLVYLDGVQQLKNYDFTFSKVRPAIAFTKPLVYGQHVQIRVFNNTDGCYVPETPTKLGLYPKFKPEIFFDTTYQTPIYAIRGHDGSIVPAFNDIRDQLLLELETRIYNNIKAVYDQTVFDINTYLPGHYRSTEYTKAEFDAIISPSFLSWIGNNRIDYSTNTVFESNNPWSWTYNRISDRLTGELLPGYWRGIYNFYYGTDSPHLRPWEMLGFSEQPDWWVETYGPSPYTGGNLLMWEDLAQGLIRHGPRAGASKLYAKPGLLSMIPITPSGELLSPQEFAIGGFNARDTAGPFQLGDQGPVESAWRRSSDYPYAVQQALALMKPALYFARLANTQQYTRDLHTRQFVVGSTNQRLTPVDIEINGNTVGGKITRTAGYINWISDYLTSLGMLPAPTIQSVLHNMSVRLGYKAAGFTDHSYLRVLAEQSSPTSLNSSIIIPDENYAVHLHKSSPVNRVVYSAVIIEKTVTGFSVSGYNTANPYFIIIPSSPSASQHTVTVSNASAVIYQDYEQSKIAVPYSHNFVNKQQVADFLMGYGRFLNSQGLIFDEFDQDLASPKDWELSVKEFLTWTLQGWTVGSVLVVSPISSTLTAMFDDAVVDEIKNSIFSSKILDVSFNVVPSTLFNVVRDGRNFAINAAKEITIGLVDLSLVQFEHVLVFDNETVFNDIIYKPELGNRQFRLKLVGNKTGDWVGEMSPPGFVFSNANLQIWTANHDYKKGEMVSYKGLLYVALTNVDAADEFVYGLWKQLERSSILSGLLPNFSYNAKQFENLYDLDNQILDRGFNTYANGLIGYRKRQYLTDLGATDESQVKFYQGFIKDKGTAIAVTSLENAAFNNIAGSMIYKEEWAFRVGHYGATESDQFFEVQLHDTLFDTDVQSITLLNSGDKSEHDNIVGIMDQQLFKRPVTFSKNVFALRNASSDYMNDFKSAGFVNLEDIDDTVFDFENLQSLNYKVDSIGRGYKIWIANDNKSDWNVYRLTETSTRVISINYLSGNKAEVEFSTPHMLLPDESFLVKSFSAPLDGFYIISQLLSPTKLIVSLSKTGVAALAPPNISAALGDGRVYFMLSMKLQHLTDLTFTPALGWSNTDIAWVSQDTNAGWAVYKKKTPWEFDFAINTDSTVPVGGNFGSVTAMSRSGMIFLAADRKEVFDDLGNSQTVNAISSYVNAIVGRVETEIFSGDGTRVQFALHVPTVQDSVAVTVGAIDLTPLIDYTVAGNILTLATAPALSDTITVAISVNETTNKFVRSQTLLPEETTAEYGRSLHLNDLPPANDHNGMALVGAVGEVYMYTVQPGGTLFKQGLITPLSADPKFGVTVKASQDNTLIFIAASDKVHVYSRTAVVIDGVEHATTALIHTITAPVPGNFGKAMAVNDDGSMLLVGAPDAIIDGVRTGEAYLYTLFDGVFTLAQIFKLGRPIHDAQFGTTLCFANKFNDVLIGAPGYTVPGYAGGKVIRYLNRSQTYNTVTGYNLLSSITLGVPASLIINGVKVDINTSTIVDDINAAGLVGVTASVVNDQLSIGYHAPSSGRTLSILPYIEIPNVSVNVLDLFGISVFEKVQEIEHPYASAGGQFGQVVTCDPTTDTAFISGKNGSSISRTIIDDVPLDLDSGNTLVDDIVPGTGAIYVFDLLKNSKDTFASPSVMSFIQQLVGPDPHPGDRVGESAATAKQLLFVGAPGDDYNNTTDTNEGRIFEFSNVSRSTGWEKIRSESVKVDTSNITKLFLYGNKSQEIITNLDYIDPAKGKILGIADQDIDFKSSFDPAGYNTGKIGATFIWGDTQVGKVWWDISTVRFIDYEQGPLTYRIQNWGKFFPGSIISVSEWVKSTLPPSKYVGAGVPKYVDDSAYVQDTIIDPVTGIIQTNYYFWVTGRDVIESSFTSRRLSTKTIAEYIESPKTAGIPYAAITRSDSLSVFNSKQYISASDTILHVDYSLLANTNIIHNEYELVKEGLATDELPVQIVNKLIDSITGENEFGNQVPDNTLNEAERYGISVRPRQTMIADRLSAIRNLVGYANRVMLTVPAALQFDLTRLFTSELPPARWDPAEVNLTVKNLEELSYVDIATLIHGQEILVLEDALFNGGWTIHRVSKTPEVTFGVVRSQSYRVTDYWDYADWIAEDYDPTEKPTHIVESLRDITQLQLKVNETIFVKDNGHRKFEVYKVNADFTTRLVGVKDGTIKFSDALWAHDTNRIGFDNAVFDAVKFDLNPALELRIIIETLRDNIFVNTLSEEFSKLFFVLLKYILTEQRTVDWMFKTSFISIVHKLRKLEQFPNYIKDNQSYYQDYINEVKPYRTKIREYLVDYSALDDATVDATDFDLPSYYDPDFGTWRSPSGEHARDDFLLTLDDRYFKWAGNHSYYIDSVYIDEKQNSGYFSQPTLTVEGGGGTGAKIEAELDFFTGKVIGVRVLDPGTGYTSTPRIIVDDDPSSSRKFYPIMKNDTVRAFDTSVKFDRVSYSSAVKEWTPNTVYTENDIVAYRGKAYSMIIPVGQTEVTSGTLFNPSIVTLLDASSLTNAVDRVVAYYKPNLGMTPKDPRQLFYGVEYPTVNLVGAPFANDSGTELDVIIESEFTDHALGSRTEDVLISGGGFVDEFSSHSPEELIPGIIYDTLDIQVFTVDPALINNSTVGLQVPSIGFRISKTVANEVDPYYEYVDDIPIPKIAVLTEDLSESDAEIAISSVAKLGVTIIDEPGNWTFTVRGAVYINGEKIPYTSINKTTVGSVVRYSLSIDPSTRSGAKTIPWSINGVSTPIAIINPTKTWEFRRICDGATTKLAQPLHWDDTEIIVENASLLPAPNPGNAVPGIVYINGEKIAYYARNLATNTLSRLSRGTWGTGTPLVHDVETTVVDASSRQKVPGNPEFNVWLALSSTVGEPVSVIYGSLWDSPTVPSPHQSDVAKFLRACTVFVPAPGAFPDNVDPNAHKTRFDDDGTGQYLRPIHPFDIDDFDSYSAG